jgi:3-keto-5-aminohexanoate cleavage enzyme
LPPDSTWSVLGVGPAQFPTITLGILLGGHIRVGFEDNLYISKGVLAKSNAEQVGKAASIARILDREVATAKDARQILGLGGK